MRELMEAAAAPLLMAVTAPFQKGTTAHSLVVAAFFLLAVRSDALCQALESPILVLETTAAFEQHLCPMLLLVPWLVHAVSEERRQEEVKEEEVEMDACIFAKARFLQDRTRNVEM